MKPILIAAVFTLLGVSAEAQAPAKAPAKAAGLGSMQAGSNEDMNIRAYIELLRTDVRKSKSQILGDVMQLDTGQAAKFWPIYKEFETNYSALGDKVVVLVKDYADNYDKMTDTIADRLGSQVLTIEQERNELKKTYYRRVKAALGAIMATRFLQVENQLERLIDLQTASLLPVMSQP